MRSDFRLLDDPPLAADPLEMSLEEPLGSLRVRRREGMNEHPLKCAVYGWIIRVLLARFLRLRRTERGFFFQIRLTLRARSAKRC